MKSSSALVAKAVLFNERGEILILRRSATDKIRPGEFDLPGGRVDPGESPGQAIVREIEEETGLVIALDDLLMGYTTTTFYDNKSTIRFLYVGNIIGDPKVQLSFEHDAYYWMKLDEVY